MERFSSESTGNFYAAWIVMENEGLVLGMISANSFLNIHS